MGQVALRIGNAEREQAVAALAEHYSAGRLETDEYTERVGRAYAARYHADLDALFADLPPLAPPAPAQLPARPRDASRALRVVLIVALIAACAVWVQLTRVPPFFVFPLVWFVLIRGRRNGYRW